MSIVKRFAVRKHLRNLENAAGVDEATLAEAKVKLVAAGPGLLPSLFDLLAEPSARPATQDVLGQLLSDETLPKFLDVFLDSRQVVIKAVIEILQQNRGYDLEHLFEAMSLPGETRGAVETVILHRATDFSTRFLVGKLTEAKAADRKILYRLLEGQKARAAVDLVPMLRLNDWWMRVHAMKLLAGSKGAENVVADVRHFLSDENRYVRLEAVQTLGSLVDRESVPGLCAALKDRDLKVHTAAIDALVSIGDPAAVPHLIHVLSDESEYTRRGAVEVLNEVATPEAISDLVLALHDEDWWVRVRAADALGSLGGERVVDAVLTLTKSEDVFIRRYAVEILNSIPSAKSVEHLIETLGDPDWWVRERSIDALGAAEDPRAVEPLLRLLETDQQAAPLCARALGKMGDPRAVEPLMNLSASPAEPLRNGALAALEDLVQSELPLDMRTSIREFLMDPNSASARPGAQTGGAAATYAPESPRSQGLDAANVSWAQKPLDDVPRNRPSGEIGTPPLVSPASPPQTIQVGANTLGADSLQGGAAMGGPTLGGASGPSANSYANLQPGAELISRYRVIRRIGSGGFGSVYLVEDTSIDEEVILKILYPHISLDATMIQRFVQELKYNRRIVHPNVIRLYDFVELEHGHAISMEYFPGSDLSALLGNGATLSVTEVLEIIGQICLGLGAAHAEGIVHRDIKPANILIGDDYNVKICDFGLASMADSGASRITKSGILIGTPHYMAPEQINGEAVDIRSDFYSVGIMLFEMLAGHPPYQGENPVNILFQHIQGEIPILGDVRDDLLMGVSELTRQAMDRDPCERPQSAESFLSEISRLAA